MVNKATVFVPFAKVEYDPTSGHAKVYGSVTDESLDLDGQITDLPWFRTQLPKWAEWSNIREMHGSSAVGVGLATEDTGNAIFLEAKIVDKEAAIKCNEGVYKGFSYGLKSTPGNPVKITKDPGAPNGRICGGELIEISVVDRPANPNSTFSVVKNAAVSEEETLLGSALSDLSEASGLIKNVLASTPRSAALPVQVRGMVLQLLKDLGYSAAADNDDKTAYKAVEHDADSADCMCAMCKGAKDDMEKTQLVELIKGLTVEERTELGFMATVASSTTAMQEELEALKATVTELGKRVQPGGPSMAPAIPVLPSTQGMAMLGEKAFYEKLASSDDLETSRFATLKVAELDKAIAASAAGG